MSARNGKEIWLESTFTPLTHEDGTVTAILAVSHDITERKSMQTQIEASLHERMPAQGDPSPGEEQPAGHLKPAFHAIEKGN
ncbi:MAG: PAS domain S-box protein [Candidatus Moduliflexus flocculans]|nr:PAS domain S-box protein [Candidatus Moduliflexus flocculans]